MTFKPVLRYDPAWPKLRLFRLIWAGRQLTQGGWPISHKLAIALRPRLFRFDRGAEGWRLVVCGIEIHRARSHGGVFV